MTSHPQNQCLSVQNPHQDRKILHNLSNKFSIPQHNHLQSLSIRRGFFIQQQTQDFIYQETQPTPSPKLQPTRELPRKRRATPDRVIDLQNMIKVQPRERQSTHHSTDSQKKQGSEVKQQSMRRFPWKQNRKLLFFEFSQEEETPESSQQQSPSINAQNQDIESSQQSVQDSVLEKQLSEDDENQPFPLKKKISQDHFSLQTHDQKIKFVDHTTPKSLRLRTIVRKAALIQNYFLPQWNVYSREGHCHIISAKKQIGNLTANYPLSVNQNNFGKIKENYVGKVRALGRGNIYNIFDDGVSPEKLKDESQSDLKKRKRQILASVVVYGGENGQKFEMDVFVLKPEARKQELQTDHFQQISLNYLFALQDNWRYIQVFRTRTRKNIKAPPASYYDKERVMGGRSFILEDPETGQEVLYLGKNDKSQYQMDISHPLTPRLALGIALAILDQ